MYRRSRPKRKPDPMWRCGRVNKHHSARNPVSNDLPPRRPHPTHLPASSSAQNRKHHLAPPIRPDQSSPRMRLDMGTRLGEWLRVIDRLQPRHQPRLLLAPRLAITLITLARLRHPASHLLPLLSIFLQVNHLSILLSRLKQLSSASSTPCSKMRR